MSNALRDNQSQELASLNQGDGRELYAPGEADGPSTTTDRWLVEKLLAMAGDPPIAIRLWDGESFQPRHFAGSPEVTLHLHDRGALYRLLYKPMLTFGELYTEGRLTTEGDVARALEIIYSRLITANRNAGPLQRLLKRVLEKRPNANTLKGSRENINTHYDLGNRFYELWLDSEYNQYTCAYYPTPDATLEQAQAAKLELVARKLALKPGETVVEAGGGWGGLARYFARHHGVKVRSYNISHEQVSYATERAAREGLADRVEYVEDDYRNITGTYDVFVSIGMLEHVGIDNYRTLGATIERCINDDGRGLIHSIGQTVPRPLNEWIETYIFPGAYPPTLREMMEIFEPVEFSIMDVENLRCHYAQTLRHWRDRFTTNKDQVAAMFDDNFVRAWYLYLSGSISAFTFGQLQLYQVLFQRRRSNQPPSTRLSWLENLG